MTRVATVLLLVLGCAATARAYVPSRTDKGVAVHWAGGCTWILPDQSGSQDMDLPTVQQVLTKSLANWQGPTHDAGCSYLVLNQDPPTALDAHYDHTNVLKFRRDKWCRPAEKDHGEICYSPQAAAITTVFYSSDGTILDADIQMNEINFTFVWLPSNVQPRTGTSKADLENTLTHELGHFQGLDHTCWDHVTASDPLDNTGQPIPDCADLNDPTKVTPEQRTKITTATMFNFAAPVETIKRTPKSDDVQGICDTYAIARDPHSCKRPDPVGSGCSIGGRADGATLALGLAALAALSLMARACSRARRR